MVIPIYHQCNLVPDTPNMETITLVVILAVLVIGLATYAISLRNAQKLLEKNEAKYRGFIENANEGVWAMDGNFRTTFVNQRMADMLGYSAEEILNKPVDHFLFEEDLTDHQENMALRRDGADQSYERRFRRKDGSALWTIVSATALKDDHGQFAGSFAMFNDITKRKEVEEALCTREAFFRAVFEQAAVGVAQIDSHDGKFVRVNQRYCDIVGYTREEMERLTFQQVIHPDDLEAEQANMKLMLSGKIREFSMENRHVHKDGSVIWVNLAVSPLWQMEGAPDFHIAIVEDITQRKKAEEALAERELLYRTLFEGARDAIIIIELEGDGLGRIVSANPVAAKIHGYSLDEFTTLKLEDLETSDSVEDLQARIDTVLSGKLLRCEVNHRRKDGSEFPIEISANLVEIRGHKYCIGIDRDISERKQAEETLTAERSKFKSILDHMKDGVYIVNSQHEIEYVNPALTSERGEVAGRKCYEYLVGLTEPCPWCRNREVIAGDSILWERTSDTTGKTYDIFETPIKKQDGSISILLILHDVTERKIADKLLSENEQRYRALISSAGNGIIVQEDTGKVVTWNREAERIFGIVAQEVLGKKSTERDWNTFKEDGSALPASEHPSLRTLATGEPVRDQIVKIVRPDGGFSWVSVNTVPIFGVDGAKPVAVVITLTDFTERKEMERALIESEQFLRQTERIARVGGWQANPFTDELHWTQGVREIIEAPLDYSPGLEEGLKFYKPQYIPLLKEMIKNTLESGQSHAMQVEVVTTSGKNLWTEVRSLMRVNEARIPLVLGTFQDITERKDLEQQFLQAQKMEAVGTLAGGIAHDFNNILQVVIGHSELMAGDGRLPETFKAGVSSIYNSAMRGAELVRGLLTFSRRTDFDPRPLDLNRQISDLRKMLERTIPKMITINLSMSKDIPTINGDPIQIDQVLMNLALNARDAMPEGGTLTFETTKILMDVNDAKLLSNAHPGLYVLLTVTDTGSGMDDATLSHIFEPFYTTKAVGKGTGLGLAMVHGIVKQHGGLITCESKLGHGASFKVFFPAIESNAEFVESKASSPGLSGTETILVVDDEDAVRDLCQRVLERSGYKVYLATDGRQALEVYNARRDEISLVLLDFMMPEMSGVICLTELLKINPSVKTIVISGHLDDDTAKKSVAAGAKALMFKPFRGPDILGLVRQVLG